MSPFQLPETPVPAPARSRLGVLIAWVVILLCVVLLATRMLRPPPRAHEPGEQDPSRISSTQLKIIGQFAVATEGSGESAATPSANPPTTRPSAREAIEQIEVTARSPLEQVRAVMLIGEIAGGDAALQRIAGFEGQPRFLVLRGDLAALRTLYARGPDALSARDRAALAQRHGWFGTLALSWRQEEHSPARQAALEPARKAVSRMIGALAGVLGALLLGLVLLVLGIVLVTNGILPIRYRPPAPPADVQPFLESFALFMLLFTGGSLAIAWIRPTGGLPANLALAVIVPISLVYLRLRNQSWQAILDGIGWRRGTGTAREIAWGAAGYIAGLPVMAVGILISAGLVVALKKSGQMSHPIQNAPMQTIGDLLQLYLLASVWAPIVEETVFRGLLFHHLRARHSWWLAAPVSAVLFAAIHPQGWLAIPGLSAIAIVFAALREWRGSILAPMAAHALNNALAVSFMWFVLRG